MGDDREQSDKQGPKNIGRRETALMLTGDAGKGTLQKVSNGISKAQNVSF